MLERGAAEVQSHIARLDELLFKLKASFVTVWLAAVGWSMTIESRHLLVLAMIVTVAFWMFEGLFRALQSRFIDRACEITTLLNDAAALDRCFAAGALPPALVYPVAFRESGRQRLHYYLRGLVSPTVSVLYLFIGFVTYLLWRSVPFDV